jgi:hypothetical protein
MVDLKATSLHWLEKSNPFEDCCLHGGVYLKLGDSLISDGRDTDWTVSTAALNLLKTLKQNHKVEDERPLIPHCGHTMWVHEGEPDGLYLGACDIGIDWSIIHESGPVLHKLKNKTILTSYEMWCDAVCQFSDQVYGFFMTAWPKIIHDDDDQRGFELFMSLWLQYRSSANEP